MNRNVDHRDEYESLLMDKTKTILFGLSTKTHKEIVVGVSAIRQITSCCTLSLNCVGRREVATLWYAGRLKARQARQVLTVAGIIFKNFLHYSSCPEYVGHSRDARMIPSDVEKSQLFSNGSRTM